MHSAFTATVTFHTGAPPERVRAALCDPVRLTGRRPGVYSVTLEGTASNVVEAEERSIDWMAATLALQGITEGEYRLHNVNIRLRDPAPATAVATD